MLGTMKPATTPPTVYGQHAPTGEPAVIKEAYRRLHELKELMEQRGDRAKGMHKAARELYKEVRFHWDEGKKKVAAKEWTAEDFDRNLLHLLKVQEPKWEKLLKDSDEEFAKFAEPYQHLLKAEEDVIHARGEGLNTGWLGVVGKEQEEVRKIYSNKLKAKFKAAKEEYESYTSYPDGVLTQVRLMRKRTMTETAELVHQFEEKEHHGHGTKEVKEEQAPKEEPKKQHSDGWRKLKM